MTDPFMMWVLHKEHYADSRKEKIEQIIQELKEYPHQEIPYEVFTKITSKYFIGKITPEEKEYIVSELKNC